MLVTIFSFFPQRFLPCQRHKSAFEQCINYCLQVLSIWTSLNFFVWSRVNPFQNQPWFLHVCSISLLKTLWEKEKLLITSNFSFYHSVFYLFEELSIIFIKFEIVVCQRFQFGIVKDLSFGKGLNKKLLILYLVKN